MIDPYVPPLVTVSVIFCLLLLFITSFYKKLVFRQLLYLCSVTIWWHGSWALLFLTKDKSTAYSIAVLGHIGILYLPVAWANFFDTVCRIQINYKFRIAMYGGFLAVLVFTDEIVKGVYSFAWGFYPQAGKLHFVFLLYISYEVFRSSMHCLKIILDTTTPAIEKNKLKTMLVGQVMFALGSIDFLLNYNLIQIYPVGFGFSILFIIIISYALINHNLVESTATILRFEAETDVLRAELINKEKLSSLGLISAGVAHQLGNTLNTIAAANFALKRLMKKQPASDNAIKCSQNIDGAISLSKDIISSMNSISKENDTLQLNNLSEIASSGIILTKGKSFESTVFVNNIDPTIEIFCSKPALIQVFMNILSNAVDATGENGKVLMGAKIIGGFVEVSISDNGSGVKPDVLPTIFEPFSTSKSEENGTGLGLYIVKKEVDRLRGSITLSSDHQGTTFLITLPLGGIHD